MSYDMTNSLAVVAGSSESQVGPRADERLAGWLAKHSLVIKVGLVVRHVDALASSIGADVVAVNLAS